MIQPISYRKLQHIYQSQAKNSRLKASEYHKSDALDNSRVLVVRKKSKLRQLSYNQRLQGKQIITKKEYEKYKNSHKRPNHQYCGHHLSHGSKSVSLVETKTGNYAFTGLAKCGLVWRCPTCSHKILSKRRDQILDYYDEHKKNGLELGFVTLTIRHHKKQSLKDLLEQLHKNYRAFQNTRNFKKHKKSIIGQIKSTEVTYSQNNGWHPHLHILFFYNTSDKNYIQDVHNQLLTNWVKFKNNNASIDAQNAQICTTNTITDYVSKWDIGKELASSKQKTSKGLTPFGILTELITEKNKEKRLYLQSLFREYAEATYRKQRLSISRNISKLYSEIKNKTDEKLLNEIDIKKLIISFTAIIWFEIQTKHIEPLIIEAYELGGKEAIYILFNQMKINYKIHTNKDNQTIIM